MFQPHYTRSISSVRLLLSALSNHETSPSKEFAGPNPRSNDHLFLLHSTDSLPRQPQSCLPLDVNH